MSLKTNLELKKNQIGLVGTRLNFSRLTTGRSIEEHITHDWSEVVIRIRQDCNLVPDDKTKEYLSKVGDSRDPVEIVATDLLYHGCGHRELPTTSGRGCPHTVSFHDLVLDGVSRALKEKKKQGLESYVANAFEDVLDNVNARKHTRHAGQILFWNNEGLEHEGKYGGFYEAFVKINLSLWGLPQDASLLRRFFTNEEKVGKAVAQFKTYLQGYLKTDTLLRMHTQDDLFNKLFTQKQDWKQHAYQFTLALADLLEEQPEMRLCFGVPQDGEMPFDREMKLPGTQEKLAYGRYTAGTGPSAHTDPVHQLDALYRRISKSVPVKTSSYTKSQGIPLVHYGKRTPTDDESISVKRLKGIGFDEQGDLTLKVSRHELQHPAQYKVHPRQFPKLKIAIIDRSGSMALNPLNETEGGNPTNIGSTSFIPWGDNSKYHYALKGIYGIDNFLEKQGIAAYVQSEVITVASTTQGTGKGSLRNEQERRALLKKPSGGTVLNPDKLSAGEHCFLVSISDGDIQNWATVKNKYKTAIAGKDYCHIHIGAGNDFTHDLESWGIPVKYVKGDDDLSTLLLDLTSSYYKQGAFQ